ncbi:MAG: acetyl-CoA carboxylase biotin carboxylase subunit, partial [Myxococcales bacterium]|nr:acetyl-CoA carboxylase biotin carboxylase subunit [Myxococcales bacterium]
TRLQVEHPITEFVAGVDLVRTQIQIAQGDPLPFRQEDLSQRGHAIECRIYAEDTEAGFLPSTGSLLRFDIPAGYNVRVDRGFRAGDDVTVHYDPMLAKLIVHARTRDEAIDKMRWALDHFIVHGVETNIDFLASVIVHEAFRRGETTTAFIDTFFANWAPSAEDPPPEVLIAAALFDRPEKNAAIKWGLDAFQVSKIGASLPWDLLGRWRMGE